MAGLFLAAPATALTTVDLLVLYTAGAANRYGGDAPTRIQHLVSVTNQIFADSNVQMRVRLVHTEQVSYSDTKNSDKALDDLSGGSGLHNQATSLRDTHGADLVTLMRPYAGDGICGIAWVGGYRRNGQLSSWDRNHPFSHVSIDCSADTLAHELGHNMGLVHSRRQDPGGGTFKHSVGHGEDGLFVTVMAYQSAYGAPKLYRMSSPNLTCSGQPCGVPRTDPNNGADAVHSLDFVRQQLAAYRAEVVPPPPPPPPPDPPPPPPGGGGSTGGGGDPGGTNPPVTPTDPEVRVLKLKRMVAGASAEIRWAHADVSSVDLSYRASWKEPGNGRIEDAAWTPIAQNVTGGTHTWTVPTRNGKKVKVQIRAVGRDAGGAEIASHASRWKRVKTPKH